MQKYMTAIGLAIGKKNGERLGELLSTQSTNKEAQELSRMVGNTDRAWLEPSYKGKLTSPWDEVVIALIQVITNRGDPNFSVAYREQAHLVNNFFRFFATQGRWVLPALDVVLRDLRQLADLADKEAKQKHENSDALEDAARICNKAFTSCLTDRTNKLDNSRKWGTYRAIGVTLKCYIKAGKLGLSKSLLRSLTVQTDMQPFTLYPRADRVTCKYYFGLLAFLNEEWDKAYEELTYAFQHCHRGHHRNQELILTYLIPLQLHRGRLPSAILFSWFPALAELYTPFVEAIRLGDISKFDKALTWAEPRMVEKNVWIAVEKAREVCLRGLVKQVWRASDKTTRLPILSITRALALSAKKNISSLSAIAPATEDTTMDQSAEAKAEEEKEKLEEALDEAECITANMIFRGYVRGYISHERRMLVLAAKNPFPSLSSVAT